MSSYRLPPVSSRMSCFGTVCVQVQSVPVVWLRLCWTCHMGRETERNWTFTYPAPTLWVQTAMTPTPHPVVMLQICRSVDNVWGLTGLIPSVSDVPLVIYIHGGYWQFLRYSVMLHSALQCGYRVFMLMLLCSYSKEESGFMAVPLVDKGVVVVAVGYDIAPKGRVSSHQVVGWQWTGNLRLLSVPPFTSFSGNMDLMVSQVRRSVVSVVQQYSHIRYSCLLLQVHFKALH